MSTLHTVHVGDGYLGSDPNKQRSVGNLFNFSSMADLDLCRGLKKSIKKYHLGEGGGKKPKTPQQQQKQTNKQTNETPKPKAVSLYFCQNIRLNIPLKWYVPWPSSERWRQPENLNNLGDTSATRT